MTELEQRLLEENERLRRELDELKRHLLSTEIEIIDNTHVKFNGQIFHKDSKGYYSRKLTLHEAVWRFHFRDIPEGYLIHHRNEIKSDNRIENLQLMTDGEHRAWHNKHSKVTCNCAYCGKLIEKKFSRVFAKFHFCSSICQNRYRAKNKIYHEERTCVVCGKTFLTYKYSAVKTCSTECKNKLISIKKRERDAKRLKC